MAGVEFRVMDRWPAEAVLRRFTKIFAPDGIIDREFGVVEITYIGRFVGAVDGRGPACEPATPRNLTGADP